MKNGSGKFYGVNEHFKMFLDPKKYVWYCIDTTDLELFGNFQQPNYQSLTFSVELKEDTCTGSFPITLCEAKAEIEE